MFLSVPGAELPKQRVGFHSVEVGERHYGVFGLQQSSRFVQLILAVTFYISIVAAAIVVETLLKALGWSPQEHRTALVSTAIKFNYTSILDIICGVVFIALSIVFFKPAVPK
ncbi:hypothetical protein [Caballeronia sp. DA-9]|uniref:hypothetical protein n=1 Tax=Caballeronia sp. DA-9 TaxID=3436237 RepID=UPI003F66C31C